jgi:chemotaxis protein CheD
MSTSIFGNSGKQIVGIADLRTSTDASHVLITYALGSCLGVTAYDPVAKVGGLVHVMVPSSDLDPARAASSPATFVDTGVTALIDQVTRLGGRKPRLVVSVAGGAARGAPGAVDSFQIGKRNFVALRQVLFKLGINLRKQDVGGNHPRTMSLDMSSGTVFITGQPNASQQPAA